METGRPIAISVKTRYPDLAGAILDYDVPAGYANRVMNCISRAFRGIGTSPEMQDIIFLKLQNAKNMRVSEIIANPEEFIGGLRDIFGPAGTVVFEHLLGRELRREFHLESATNREQIKKIGVCDLLRLLNYATFQSRPSR